MLIEPTRKIDDQITTNDGFTFVVVDMSDTEYIVRADVYGNDMAYRGGECGRDWEYVYIPFDCIVYP